MEGCTIFSAMDIKAGFHNIPIAAECVPFAGLITQDALFVYERMAFGFAHAPAHFQALISYVLRGAPWQEVLRTGVYLDDASVGGTEMREVWRQTLEALRRLCRAGFPISLKKC